MQQPGIRPAAVRAGLSILHGSEILPAVVAVGNCGKNVDLELGTAKELLLVGSPAPAVGKVLGNDGRHLADVHDNGVYMLYAILLRSLLDVADNVKDYAQFVHENLFLTEQYLALSLDEVRQDAAELALGGAHVAGLGILAVQVNRVESALGGADAAAYALVGVYD